VDQPVLERAVEPFTAAAGLRGVGEDVLDPEACEGPAHLGGMVAVDVTSALKRPAALAENCLQTGPTSPGPVGVQPS
jgi:hypothetical protein